VIVATGTAPTGMSYNDYTAIQAFFDNQARLSDSDLGGIGGGGGGDAADSPEEPASDSAENPEAQETVADETLGAIDAKLQDMLDSGEADRSTPVKLGANAFKLGDIAQAPLSILATLALCVLSLESAVADPANPPLPLVEVSDGDGPPLLAMDFQVDGEPVRMLIDSGVEAPVLDSSAAERLGLELIEGPAHVDYDAVRQVTLTISGEPPAYRGPMLVGDTAAALAFGTDGVFPPNMLYFQNCRLLDPANRRFETPAPETCRALADSPGAVRLDPHISDPRTPYWRSLLTAQINGETRVFLVDTGATLSLVSPDLADGQALSSIGFRNFDYQVRVGHRLEDICLKTDDGALFAETAIAAELEEPAPITGLVGLDMIADGRILYLSRERSYLLPGEASRRRTCAPD